MPWDGDDLAGKMEENLERQQAAAEDRAKTSTSSAEDRARNAQLESLRLSRSRVMVQLSRATVPAHRTMLERALKAIDDQMSEKQ
jgi:glutathionyl-hydroquinone reductase